MLLILKMNFAAGATLGLCFVGILIRYIIIEYRCCGFQRHRLGAAIALLISWIGGIGICLATWVHLHEVHNVPTADSWTQVIAVCALILGVGALCCIRHFAPDEYVNRIWVSSSIIAGFTAGFAWWY